MADTKRYELHEKLCTLLGSRNVYYQPPPTVRMSYPAIVYKRSTIANNYANDDVYIQNFAYDVTVIDSNPDSRIVFELSKFPKCRFNRHYTSDNLNHDVFTIYY